jgi:putative transposase
LNQASGSVYTGVLVAHWRLVRKKGLWLSETAGTRWSDRRSRAPLHAHSIDAAQQGFYRACTTTRALRKAGIATAKFPYRRKRFRTTVWKSTTIKRQVQTLRLSNGRGQDKILITLPAALRDARRVLEVRLVYDKRAERHTWHIVVEDGKQPKSAPGGNVVAVDPGEIHPATVGDQQDATIITCRHRRSQSQGHAKRLAKVQKALARKRKGSRRHRRLVRAKVRMKAKHQRVMRDLEHKISRAVVGTAVDQKARTIVLGDVRDVADGVDCGRVQNRRMSRWDHGKIRQYITYKVEAEGIAVALEDESYTSPTCPHCGHRHKPKGRLYRCPACGFQAHRDVVGQINILSRYTHGAPGKLPAPCRVKYRIPHDVRVLRRCQGTGQAVMPVARGPLRETAGT